MQSSVDFNITLKRLIQGDIGFIVQGKLRRIVLGGFMLLPWMIKLLYR
jgi:hypothetical protein